MIWRDASINDTKIKYLNVLDKIYEVTSINWRHLTLEAKETELSMDDVPEAEIWNMSDLAEFKIRLVNRRGVAEVIDLDEWRETRQ